MSLRRFTPMPVLMALLIGASALAGGTPLSIELNNPDPANFGYVRVADSVDLEPAQLTLEAWITHASRASSFEMILR